MQRLKQIISQPISLALLCCLLLSMVSLGPPPLHAQEPAPLGEAHPTAMPFTASPEGVTEIDFEQLDVGPFSLQAPIDQQAISFDIPYRWRVKPTISYLDLRYDFLQQNAPAASEEPLQFDAALINVLLNGELLTVFTPQTGPNQRLLIPFTPAAIAAADGNYKLELVYFVGDCEGEQSKIQLQIREQSFIHFEYTVAPLRPNLAQFPRPLLQNPFIRETVLIIIPEQYNQDDLEAAASVAATMGLRSFNFVDIQLLTTAQVTPEQLSQHSAILIGEPIRHEMIRALYTRNRLPTILTQNGERIAVPGSQTVAPDDGIIQEVLSEYSADHVYLIVTSSTAEGVAKAARALSVLEPRFGFEGDLVLVDEFLDLIQRDFDSRERFTLNDLGVGDQTIYGMDANTISTRFFIPPNWQILDEPTFTLEYVHSAMLQATGSGITVKLNDAPVGSAPINQIELGKRDLTFKLPKDDIKVGADNRLSIDVIINVKLEECVLPDFDLVWLRINDASELYLPHQILPRVEKEATLRDAFNNFSNRQDLSDIWYALSTEPTPTELHALANISVELGSRSGGPGFAPQVSLGAISDTTVLEPFSLIGFGLPSTNPLLATMNEALPQSFVPGEDTLRQEVGNVIYRLPSSFQVGMLQTLPAPWNPGKVILWLTGTSSEAVTWAIETLLDDETYFVLQGDLAFVRPDYLETIDSTDYIRAPIMETVDDMRYSGEQISPEPVATVTPLAAASTLPLTNTEANTSTSAEMDDLGLTPELFKAHLAEDLNTDPPFINEIAVAVVGLGIMIAGGGAFWTWRSSRKKDNDDDDEANVSA